MKKIFSLLAAVLFAGSMMAADATMTAGTNASACTVNEKDGIKCGTSKNAGDMTITVGAGATKLTLYAAAWKGVSGASIDITAPSGVEVAPASLALTADDGISNNSPFTLVGSESDFKFEIALANVNAETTLTLACGKRFVVWSATYEAGEAPAVATPVISGDAEFTESTTVTITCATEGAEIFYTLDGTEPTKDATKYTAAFKLTVTTTVKAIAIKGEDKSSVVEKTFTKVEPLQPITCAEVYNKVKNDEVLLNDVTVTYANGKNVYVKDATGAMLVYLSEATTWKAGDVLSGVAGVVDIYNGLYEVKPSADQVAAVTATPGEAPAAIEMTTAPVAADMNKYVLLKNVTVSAATFPSNKNMNATIGEETFVLRNNFNADVAFDTEKKYDIIGTVAVYNATVQVYFINADVHQATAVDNTAVDAKIVKAIRNGQVVLIRDGKVINMFGVEQK